LASQYIVPVAFGNDRVGLGIAFLVSSQSHRKDSRKFLFEFCQEFIAIDAVGLLYYR
jgi:hypothetical protein